jgi:hypothetical protein
MFRERMIARRVNKFSCWGETLKRHCLETLVAKPILPLLTARQACPQTLVLAQPNASYSLHSLHSIPLVGASFIRPFFICFFTSDCGQRLCLFTSQLLGEEAAREDKGAISS